MTTTSHPNFDLIARPYRWLEYLTLGRALERCRFHFLSRLRQQKHALTLGDGDGRFLAALIAQNPALRAHAVDTSAAMLRLLQQRCERADPNAPSRLRLDQSSALASVLDPPYDLVVTHFFLDCLTQPELEALIRRTVPTLSPSALWLVSDFRIPHGLMRRPAQVFIRSLYLAFRILTGLRTTRLPDHATPLHQAGLARIDSHYPLAGMLTAELWQVKHTSLNSQ